MAGKVATVFIIDVGPSMWQKKVDESGTTAFDLSSRAIQIMLENKVISERKTDMTSVVAVGTNDTDNPLSTDEKHDHISVLNGIEQPKLSILRKVRNDLPRGDISGDCLSAVEVAIKLISDHCKHLKYIKKIYLFTDGESTITKSNHSAITNICGSENEIRYQGQADSLFRISCFLFNISQYNICVYLKAASENFWREFVRDCGGDIFTMRDFLNRLELPQIRAVKPTPVYKGFLTLGDVEEHPESSLSIPIEMYHKTSITRPPTAKKWSIPAEMSTLRQKTHEVYTSKVHVIIEKSEDKNEGEKADEANQIEVPLEDLEKAYTFGKTIIPIPSYDEEVLGLHTIQSMCMLGFIKAEDYRQEYCLSNISVILPPKDNLDASLRLSSLIQALFIKNAYALVRYVSKTNKDPRLAILVPHLKTSTECLYFAKVFTNNLDLPFCEDYRKCVFPSLENIVDKFGKKVEKHKNLPTPEMLDKMGEYINGMNLMEAALDNEGNAQEHLKVKEVYNPVLFRIQKAISHRALHPDDSLILPDEKLTSNARILPSLVEKNKHLINEMRDLFKITKVPPKVKRRRAEVSRKGVGEINAEEILGSKEEEFEEVGIKKHKSEINGTFCGDILPNSADIRKIGYIDPVGDFTKMIENRQEDLVTTVYIIFSAVEQMCKIITDLAKTLVDDTKAIQCLKALREVSAREDESERFNEFLQNLRKNCLDRPLAKADFWQHVVDSKITLISSDEAPDSNISKEDANKVT
ncbi:hypothetical protein G9A89_019117 [Geosiphon pyriformis]|nr:hypothetical protein G9A89_019117 [Geosiphon pyriformis]